MNAQSLGNKVERRAATGIGEVVQTHDYKRHGTTTLFAALNTLDGTVLSS